MQVKSNRFSFNMVPAWAPPDAAAGPAASTGGSSAPGAGGGGSGSQPTSPSSSSSATPDRTPPASTPAEGGMRDSDEGLATDAFDSNSFFGFDGEGVAPPPSPPAVAAPTAPVVQEPPVVPQAPEAPQQAQPQAQVPSAQVPAPGSQTPQLSLGNPNAIADALVSQQTEALKHIAETTFKLSPEEVAALEENAVAEIPKLLAKATYHAQVNALRSMANILPAMMQQFMSVTRAQSGAQREFFSKFPQFKEADHGPTIMRVAQTYRAANPQASRAQMFEDVAHIVGGMLKIPMTGAPTASASVGSNGRSPPASPFVPAVAGVVNNAPAPEDPFGWMTKDQE
jgi:hypothetical protein